jgi:acyl-coenzyme A thioesterase PaaI-like protein
LKIAVVAQYIAPRRCGLKAHYDIAGGNAPGPNPNETHPKLIQTKGQLSRQVDLFLFCSTVRQSIEKQAKRYRIMDVTNLSPEVMQRFGELMAGGHLQLPPPIMVEMDGRIETIELEHKRLTVSFPVQPRYQNPVGYMQGGMIAAAVDNAIGPLSFLVAPPSVTKTLAMSYLLPVSPTTARVWVTAQYHGREGSELRFSAEVHSAEGKVFARADALHVIIRERGKKNVAPNDA